MENDVAVIGAGGHAKVVISSVRAAGLEVGMLLDDDPEKWGCELSSAFIEGPIARFSGKERQRAVLAVGDNGARMKLASLLDGCAWVTLVHPRAYVHPSVQLGAGTVVFAGAVIQPDVRIGSHCIINSGATIDHDCVIGNYVHIAPGVNIAGNVHVGDGVFLGIGSAVITGKRLGEWTIVGAGGVVVTDLPDHVVAAGVPAKKLKNAKGSER